MASPKIQFLAIAMLVVVGTQVLSNNRVSSAADECESKIPQLKAQCSKYVQIQGPKMHPSKACCAVVKNINVPCICKHITKEVEKIVSMEKVIYVGRTCGLSLKAGTKCGSYTIPPMA